MKKIIALLLSVLMFMSITVTAFADMDGPSFVEYVVYVSNPEGIHIHEEYEDEVIDFIIPYNEKLTVQYEDSEDKTVAVEYKNHSCYVSENDVAKVVAKVGKDSYKLSETYEKIIINKKGAELRDGPARSYAVVGKIPYGKNVKSNYGIGYGGVDSENDEHGLSWLFVSYGNYSGWLECTEYDMIESGRNCATVVQKSDRNYVEVIGDGYFLYDMPEDTKKISGQIAKDTKLSYKYSYSGLHSVFYYVNYNGVNGWIQSGTYENNSFSCAEPCDAGVYTKKEVSLCKSPKHGNKFDVITTIPANQLLAATKKAQETIVYYESARNWFFVNYKGYSGWICSDVESSKASLIDFSEYRKIKLGASVSLLSEPNKNSKKLSTIPKGTVFECMVDYYGSDEEIALAKYNGKYGWVFLDDYVNEYFGYRDFTDFYTGKLDSEEETTTTTTTTTELSTAPEISDADEPSESAVATVGEGEISKRMNPKTVVIFCVVVAVVVAITGVVLIKLLKKKKMSETESENTHDDLD